MWILCKNCSDLIGEGALYPQMEMLAIEFFTNYPQKENTNIANFVSAMSTSPIQYVTLKCNPSPDIISHLLTSIDVKKKKTAMVWKYK